MTQEKIAKMCNKKIGAVKRALKELQDANIIKKIKNGQYMINPSIYAFDTSDDGELQKALIRKYDPYEYERIQNIISDTYVSDGNIETSALSRDDKTDVSAEAKEEPSQLTQEIIDDFK